MEHFCNEHGTVFFKRGNMRGYAHPIGEKDESTGKYPEGWCNEDAEEVAKLPARKLESQPLATGEEAVSDKMTKNDWAEKERITRQSIQRQTSLKAAVEWCIAKHATEPVKTVMVLTVASLFEAYLESGVQVEKK